MIEAEIGDDPVDPGIERTFKTEAAQILVGLEEGLLINVLGVRLRSRQVQRQTQDRLIVMTHQDLEGSAVSLLRLADQTRVVNTVALHCQAPPHGQWSSAAALCRRPRTGIAANRNCYCVRIGRHCLSLVPYKWSNSSILPCTEIDGAATRTLADYKELALDLLDGG